MRHFFLVACLLAAALLSAGCSNSYASHAIKNASTITVIVTYERGGDVFPVRTLEPGKMAYLNSMFQQNECSDGTFIARAEDGREVARRSDPLCPSDTWVIDVAGH